MDDYTWSVENSLLRLADALEAILEEMRKLNASKDIEE